MNKNQRARLTWVKLFKETEDAGFVCRRCGISRPTLRKWVKRFDELGCDGLISQSRRPHSSPAAKVTPQLEEVILSMRKDRQLGAKRISSELLRLHDIYRSAPTIQKAINRAPNIKPIQRPKWRKKTQRYSRAIPGDRVQVDVCKIAPNIYHYCAIDDCSRYRVIGIYPRKTAANTLLFYERMVEEMPFPIEKIQSDRGREFFAVKVQRWLMNYSIKFRPIKPRSPHLNGKVERSHKTDLTEFYSLHELDDPQLEGHLAEWQHFYNWYRPHSSLGGKTPNEKCHELSEKTPYWDEVEIVYFQKEERAQEQNYRLDLELRKLK